MSDILTEVHPDEGVGVLTLNRPDRRNAFSGEMLEGLAVGLQEFAQDDRVGAVLLTGAGGAFSAGGDVQKFAETHAVADSESEGSEAATRREAEAEQQYNAQVATVSAIYRHPKPVIAALPGAVAGAGVGLALAADFRIGCDKTVFTTAFINVGLSGDFGVAWLLNQLVGPARARELLFLSSKLRGQEVLDAGLVHQIVDSEELETVAFQAATRLSAAPSAALARMKKNLLEAPTVSLEESMRAEVSRHKECEITADHIAAVNAFVTKQPPRFAPGWAAE